MNTRLAALVAAAVLSVAGTADARSYAGAMGAKAVHALADIIYAPFEVIVTPIAWSLDFERNDRRALTGFLHGVVPGAGLAVNRLERGVSDLITFPIVSAERDYAFEWFIVPPKPLSGFEQPD